MNSEPIDWNDPKFNDPMEEPYAIRRHISQKYNHDIHQICAAVRAKDARAKALGMTYGEYCLAQLEGTLPSCACKESAEYRASPAENNK